MPEAMEMRLSSELGVSVDVFERCHYAGAGPERIALWDVVFGTDGTRIQTGRNGLLRVARVDYGVSFSGLGGNLRIVIYKRE